MRLGLISNGVPSVVPNHLPVLHPCIPPSTGSHSWVPATQTPSQTLHIDLYFTTCLHAFAIFLCAERDHMALTSPVCVCVCVCVSIYLSVCVSVCLCMRICLCAQVCVSVRACVCVYACLYVCVCVCVSACVHVWLCMYICVICVGCLCLCECVTCVCECISTFSPQPVAAGDDW